MLKLIRKKSIKQPSLFSWTKKNSDDVLYDYPSMVKFMIELYDTVEKAPIDYMEQFTNTKQGDETIPFYYASILKYGYLAFPESKEEERDGYMKNQFIKGLKNPVLRNHIRMEDTSKMELVEVKDLTRKYEN